MPSPEITPAQVPASAPAAGSAARPERIALGARLVGFLGGAAILGVALVLAVVLGGHPLWLLLWPAVFWLFFIGLPHLLGVPFTRWPVVVPFTWLARRRNRDHDAG